MKSPTDITLRMTIKGREDWVMAVDLSGTTVISGSSDHTIKVQSRAVIIYNKKCKVHEESWLVMWYFHRTDHMHTVCTLH